MLLLLKYELTLMLVELLTTGRGVSDSTDFVGLLKLLSLLCFWTLGLGIALELNGEELALLWDSKFCDNAATMPGVGVVFMPWLEATGLGTPPATFTYYIFLNIYLFIIYF